jgi:type II secretion system protein H
VSCTARQFRPRSGFTLLELVLVMMMLTIIVAIAAPSLRGFRGWSQQRDAATQLVAVTQYAKAKAAAEAKVYRLELDGTAYRVVMQEGPTYIPSADEFGRTVTLPDGVRVEILPIRSSGGYVDRTGISFYPEGRTDPALLRMTDSRGRVTLVACPSPAESFRVVSAQEAAGL